MTYLIRRMMLLVAIIFIAFLYSIPDAEAKVQAASSADMKKCLSAISTADLVLLDGAVTVQRIPGWQVKWNSSVLKPGLPNGQYGGTTLSGEQITVGGINNVKEPLRAIALIPLFQYRDKHAPNEELVSVQVNGKAANCFVLLPGDNVKEAIKMGLQRFKNDKLFQSQLSPDTPTLFIDAGTVGSGKSLRIEYETKPRSIRVN